MADYEQRFVAFIDILGFSRAVEESAPPARRITLDQLREALQVPEPVQADKVVVGRIGDISRSGHRLNQFSDTIVVSTQFTEAGLMHLLMHAEKIGFRLLKLGFLCRGGIASGWLYHDDAIVLGPALLAAYHIEKNVAKHPRIVLDVAVAQWGLALPEPVGDHIKRLTWKHEDGHVGRRRSSPGGSGSPCPQPSAHRRMLPSPCPRSPARQIQRR